MTSKSDIVRDYIKSNPQVDRKDLPRIMYESYPDIFVSLKRAWAVVANVEKHKPRSRGTTEKTQTHRGALSAEQLRSMHDIRSIVMNELKSLRKTDGGEFWLDADFVRRFRGRAGYRSILESPDAAPYRGKGDGKVYWSHPDSIKKMKQEGTLI